MKISLCMIVKDEENNIINCLDRALKMVDEAIIVDTGSQDRTKDIIRESYGKDLRVKLIEYPWENDFSKARNQSIKHATGDWILVLDADERIFADRQKLEEYTENKSNKTYIIPIYNIMSKDDITITSSMIRFYKNENPRYEGAIHEQILVDGQKSLGEVVDGNICRIYHYGYTHSVFSEKDKENRNMDIIMNQIEVDPDNPFHWYNKGVMEMAKGNNEIAIDDFTKSHHLTKKVRTSYHNDLVLRIIKCMLNLKKHKKAIEFINTVYKDPLIGEIPDLYYYWGIAYVNAKKYSLAIKNFKKATEIGEYEKGISKFGVGSFLSKIEWAKILLLEKKTDLAIEKFKDAVFDPHNVRHKGINELQHLLKKENRLEELERIKKSIEEKEKNITKPESNKEFEKYKNEVKENIKALIEKGMLQESKELIKSYEEIVKDDVEIYSIKGTIALMEGNINKAENLLLSGINKDSNNFDILYNLGFLYQSNEQIELGINYYKRALQNASDENDENEVHEILKKLGVKENKSELMKKNINNTSSNYEVNPLDELESYQKQFKENIKLLIEQGLLQEAKEVADEYEKIVKDDRNIYSIRSVIAIMEGNIDWAYEVIMEGLNLFPKDSDLLYNKAYILEHMKDYKQSYKLYKRIFDTTTDKDFKEEVSQKLNEIKGINNCVDLSGTLSLLVINKKANKTINNFIVNWFNEFGFTIVKTITPVNLTINKYEVKQAIILYDLNPINTNIADKKEYPDIDNKRYFLIGSLQKQLELEFGIKNINDHLYLTKNELEAEKILGNVLEEKELKNIYAKIEDIDVDYKSNYPVLKLFDGFRHRAKTELIQYRDGLAVKKTWKPGNEKFLEREKFAYGELSKTISYIPPLLESGENYIIIPYYENMLEQNESAKKRILTTHIMEVASFFKELYEAGYFNPDIHPGQFVFSKESGLKAIDFEYLQAYEKSPQSFIYSYDIKGYPENFRGDKPNYVGKGLHRLYNNLWIKYTGYNLEQIANLVINGQYAYDDPEINKVLGLLNYAKTSGKSYDGSMYGSAYHSLRLKGYYFRGQRECELRLQKVPYDFSDKTVLDIGCNAGGMLHSLSDKIKMGIGIDYDYRLINSANAIKKINNSNNLSFYRFDLENEDLNLIKNYILSENGKIDICFLLSVCMWITNWKEVIKFVSIISKNLLFETNGTHEQQEEQMLELRKNYTNIEIIEEESNDDPGQPNRKLILCKNESEKLIIENNIQNYNVLLESIIKPKYEIFTKNNNLPNKKISKIYVNADENEEIDFKKYMDSYFDFEFYRSYFNISKNIKNIEGIITGLSYFEVGINTEILKRPFENMAISSQDLFYDFAMLKYVIEELDKTSNIKQVILGLSNYSFRYDLSLTQNPRTKEKSKIYYPILKKLHNYSHAKEAIKEYNVFEKQFSQVFKKEYIHTIYKMEEKKFNTMWNHMTNQSFNSILLNGEQKRKEIYLAQRWDQKYVNTIKENVDILGRMLVYLKNRNIQVTVVTNPVTKFYKRYFSEACREEFLKIIYRLHEEFNFNFIDGYNMDCFEDSDFYDSSHLNKKGAEKFTEIINMNLE